VTVELLGRLPASQPATPQDQDIFLISAEKATDACRHSVQRDQRISRFNNELIIPLSVWCNQHRDRLFACYLVMPNSSVLPVYMVGASEKYDFELTDMLGELAGKFKDNGWSVHFSQLPRSDDAELAGYFSLKDSLQVYGD